MRRRRADRARLYRSRSYTELAAQLAATVRALRLARRWTQEHAAEQCGLAPRMLQAIEAGDANATLVTLARLADGFGVDGATLLAPPRRRA
jgi:transcriptional regulator with XRE-family HTH domain